MRMPCPVCSFDAAMVKETKSVGTYFWRCGGCFCRGFIPGEVFAKLDKAKKISRSSAA